MFILSFILFLSLIKVFLFLQLEYISDINAKNKNYLLKDSNNIIECLQYFDSVNLLNSDFLELFSCVVHYSKEDIYNLQLAISLLNLTITNADLNNLNDSVKLIIKSVNDSLHNGVIIDMHNIIKNTPSILYNISNIIDEARKGENMSLSTIYKNLNSIFNAKGFDDLMFRFYNTTTFDFVNFIDVILSKFPNLRDIFKVIIENLGGNHENIKNIIRLLCNMVKSYYDKKNIVIIVAHYLRDNINIYSNITKILHSPAMKYVYQKLIKVDDAFLNIMKDTILENTESTDWFYEIIKNDTLINITISIIFNVDDDNYLKDYLPILLESIVTKNSTYVNKLTNIILDFSFRLVEDKPLNNETFTVIQRKIYEIFLNYSALSYNVSQDCLDLFNYTYFDFQEKDKTLFLDYLQKYIIATSRSKNYFLTFDTCLDIYHNSKEKYGIYKVHPNFVIGIVNEPDKLHKLKNTSFYLKYNYIRSHCLPNGFKNETAVENNIPMCSTDDYNKVLKFVLNFLTYDNIRTINSFQLNRDNIIPTNFEIFNGLLSFLLLTIPLIIFLVLVISKSIIKKNQKIRNISINELADDNENMKKDYFSKKELAQKNDNFSTKKVIFPKWILYLNEFFNIFKNGSELFNFSLNNTNFNNFNGMTYIKGLIGISVILTIGGQTYIALVNLPTRVYGIYDFYRIISSALYIFLFIGYRYSPRVLFSCSGYSLIYKYLCYIEQEQGLYFLKFVFLQSYKYILLLIILILFRYSLYFINILFRQTKRPVWEIFKYYIGIDDNFFVRLFSFLFNTGETENEIRQNLIFYFYIPINETFFFIFGTILISLGYKYKLRIDIIILVLIFLLYFAKIISYLFYLKPKYGYLTTLDFYLVDYGKIFIYPAFNLTNFLIGMYFGLINYSIQKGITNLYRGNNYNNNIILLRMSESEKNNIEESDTFLDKKNTFTKKRKKNNLSSLSLNDDTKKNNEFIETNKFYNNDHSKLRKMYTIKRNKKNIRKNNLDINIENNENLEKLIAEDNNPNNTDKKEYCEKIKQMPFLISPIKFSNFHRIHIHKCFMLIFTIISFLILLFFVSIELILISSRINLDEKNSSEKSIEKLDFENIIPDWTLNIIYLLDIEITVFIIQWLFFILYFKKIEIIKSFLNHIFWSFFVKTYYTFSIISIPVILYVFYGSETMVKLNLFNIILYSFTFLILIIIGMIIIYSCFELPLKKLFKYILKGKEFINFDEDEDEEEFEDEESEKNDEDQQLIGDDSDDEDDDETVE